MSGLPPAAAFGQRLTHVCQLDGIAVRELAKIAEVSESTARRWLRGQCMPLDGMRAITWAHRLNVFVEWLFTGRGPDPKAFRLAQKINNTFNDWVRRQLWRLLFLCTNGSIRANRLLDMAAAGQISRTQLFRTM